MDYFLPPEAKKVLVISPHPDDETLACAGTISLYTSKGIDVCLVFVSNGEKSELKIANIAEIRKSEAISAADVLGVKKTIFLEFADEKVDRYKEEIKEKLTDIIKDTKPDLIFAPYPLDPHPDHKATSEIALSLMRELQSFKLAFYEVYHPIRFNILVDISSVIHKKKEAVFSYKRSLLDIPEIFWYAIEGLNVYRSLVYRRKSFYEAFWFIDSPVSGDEIMKWATFDTDFPAQIFLSRLKITDGLIHELHSAHATLREKDGEINSLRQNVNEIERRLSDKEAETNTLDAKKHQLKDELHLITSSFWWTFIRKFYDIRDTLFPSGTSRRNFYDRATKKIKKER